MKLSIFAFAAIVSVATAQLSDLPDCAKTCYESSIPSNCDEDATCICESKSFISSISCCIADKCSTADQTKTLKIAKEVCAAVKVTDLPTAAVCSSTAASNGTTTATETSSGSTTGTATGNATGTTMATSTITGTASSGSNSTATASSTQSSSTSTGGAVLGHSSDASFMAAAGAAAALAAFL